MTPLTKNQNRVSWLLQIVVAAILIQTLYFKFTAAPESVYIFSKLGLEPVGRIGSGIAELIAAVLLLIPGTAALGGLITMGVLAGAILSHLTKLGIEVQGDGGLLFGLALTCFVSGAIITWLHRRELPIVGGRL
ncbi:MAG TPA: DoxX family protein [Thermoanaerobaculia bacterium]|nr:DoxX family protein [Thermoanaerobaculia bacterium]